MTNQALPVGHKIFEIIEAARNAELCRDLPASRRILSEVWENIDENPPVEFLDESLQAEILRLCGFYLSYYGKAKNLKDYQERGKNLLTRAIEIFEAEGMPDNAAEAKVMLSLCYWHEGAVNESEAILSEIEAEYAQNTQSEVYIQICVNRLGIHFNKGEYEKSRKLIEKLSPHVRLSKKLRNKVMYHNQSGVIFWKLKEFDTAIFHFQEAMIFARKGENARFVALNQNNLACVYKDIGNFDLAHHYADKSINFYSKLGEVGWLAYILDTKALVYLAEGDLSAALITIDESLDIFRKGEDYAGLAESLYTKCEILIHLGRVYEAVELSGELMEIAIHRIGGFAVNKFSKNLAKLICAPFDISGKKILFTKESDAFKGEMHSFIVNGRQLPELKTEANLIVLLKAAKKSSGQTVIVQNTVTKQFVCGVLDIDSLTGINFLNVAHEDFPITLDKFKYFGEMVAYSEFNKYKGEIVFRPFE